MTEDAQAGAGGTGPTTSEPGNPGSGPLPKGPGRVPDDSWPGMRGIHRPQPTGLPEPSQRAVLLIGTAVVAGLLLWMGREALSPFIIGLLLVYLLNPVVERIARVGVPRWVAVLVVYAAVIVGLAEGLTLLLGPLVQQVSQFTDDLPALSTALREQLDRLGEIYRGLALPAELRESIDSAIGDMAQRAGDVVSALLMPVFSSVATFVSSIFGYLIVPVWVFFLLKDRRELTAALDRALPGEWREDVWTLVRIVQRVFGQWVRAQVILGLTVGIATYVGLMILGAVVDPVFSRFALFLALVAGLFELLPIIGPILAAIPAVLLAATVGLDAVIGALALYTLVQQVENNVLVPKIQGDAVELHPSAVMFSLVLGGAIAGLLGAILSLPIAAAGRNVYRYLYRRLEPDSQPPGIAARGLDGRPGAEGVATAAERSAAGDLPPEAAAGANAG